MLILRDNHQMPKSVWDEVRRDLEIDKIQPNQPEAVGGHQNISFQVFNKAVDYDTAIKLVRSEGLELPNYREALLIFSQPGIRQTYAGKWFFIEPDIPHDSGTYEFNERGDLIPYKGNSENKVYIQSTGIGPQSNPWGFFIRKNENPAPFIISQNWSYNESPPIAVGTTHRLI